MKIYDSDGMPIEVDSKIVSDRIKKVIEEKEISYRELSEMTDIPSATLQRYANGKTDKMLPDRIARIAEKTHTDILYLLGMNENDKPVATKKIKPKAVRIPVVGMVQAGIPADAVTDPLDWEEVTPEIAAKGDITCLQIRGDSMEPKFSEGDVVVVLGQSDVESGDIAIVRVNGDTATIKKVIKHPEGGIALVASNPTYPPMIYTDKQIREIPVEIIGKVIELRAKF